LISTSRASEERKGKSLVLLKKQEGDGREKCGKEVKNHSRRSFEARRIKLCKVVSHFVLFWRSIKDERKEKKTRNEKSLIIAWSISLALRRCSERRNKKKIKNHPEPQVEAKEGKIINAFEMRSEEVEEEEAEVNSVPSSYELLLVCNSPAAYRTKTQWGEVEESQNCLETIGNETFIIGISVLFLCELVALGSDIRGGGFMKYSALCATAN
jgi:hypothetical protein